MFSETMRELRAKKRVSQKVVGQAVYVSTSAISQYENGLSMPSRETLDRLARYYNVSTDYLLGVSEQADLEEMMLEEYINGVTVGEFLQMCLELAPAERQVAMKVVEAWAPKKDKEPCGGRK